MWSTTPSGRAEARPGEGLVGILVKLLDPEVFKIVVQSTLGILAMMIMVLGALAALFFRRAPVGVQVMIFLLIFSGVVAFGVAVVRETPADERPIGGPPTSASIPPGQSGPGPTIEF